MDEPADEPLGAIHERSAAGNFSTWTAWTMPVNVCFINAPSTDPAFLNFTLTASEYASMKTVSMTGLSETWARVPGVSFVNAGDCTGSMNSHLHLKLTRGGGGTCGGGFNTTCEVRAHPSALPPAPPWVNPFKAVLAHEVGHALGLAHEHKRNDTNPPSCEANRVAACVSCKASIDAASPCSVANYNTCFFQILPAVSEPQSFAQNSSTYQQLLGVLGNNQTDNSLELLTMYDPLSIMNYCAGDFGRAGDDFMPTKLDLLGLEMTYPLPNGHRLGCKRGCFDTPSGLITRRDAVIQTDWAERGALNSKIMVSGTLVSSINTAALTAGVSTLTYEFQAPCAKNSECETGEEQLVTASGTLVNSNSVHTAVAMTAL